jgi:hypothetical protein
MARRVKWDGQVYSSLSAAARAAGVKRSVMERWVNRGFQYPGDVRRGYPLYWNGKRYRSFREAGIDNFVDPSAMCARINKGWVSDTDIPDRRNQGQLPVVWNGVQYPSIRAAAKAIGISPTAMHYRITRGYTCDDDLYK